MTEESAPDMKEAEPICSPYGIDAICMACTDATCDFKPRRFQRRPLGPRDVLIDMKYCGVCHSDLHAAADHMQGVGMKTAYPCTPGHELAGICTAVGSEVSKFKVGDQVGVGCLVDSCHECDACKRGDENKCVKRTGTYNGQDKNSNITCPPGGRTIGGYSSKMVVDQSFGILIPPSYPLKCAGPVMCAGVTMYDPLKVEGAKEGTRVGIIGLGGLGVMGIKLAKALGCKVTAISRSKGKEEFAKECGAETFIASGEPNSLAAGAKSLDLILNTIPANHNWAEYQPLLDKGGRHVILGASSAFGGALYAGKIKNISVKTSMIGGIANTQEVIDLCAKHNIYPEIELAPVQKLGEIFEALDSANDTGKRYVLDLEGSLNDEAFESCTAPPPKLSPNQTSLNYGSVVHQTLRMLMFG